MRLSNRIRKELSPSHKLKKACINVGGTVEIDYDSKSVTCKLPSGSKITITGDYFVDLKYPNGKEISFDAVIDVAPLHKTIAVKTIDGDYVL